MCCVGGLGGKNCKNHWEEARHVTLATCTFLFTYSLQCGSGAGGLSSRDMVNGERLIEVGRPVALIGFTGSGKVRGVARRAVLFMEFV